MIFSVTIQHFEVDIFRESVMIGNDAIFKCSAPSFVSDFVSVDSWVDSEGNVLNSAVSGNSNLELFSFKIRIKDFHCCCMKPFLLFSIFQYFQ